MYRLVASDSPNHDDFRSQRTEKPHARFPKEISECHARGLSLFLDVNDARQKRALPNLRHKLICAVTLVEGFGCIEKTFSASHHTWWPFLDCDILSNCAMLAE